MNLEAYKKVRKVPMKQGVSIRPEKGAGYKRHPKHKKRDQ